MWKEEGYSRRRRRMWNSPRTSPDPEALEVYFQAQAQVSASPVWALGQTDSALSLVAVPLLFPLFPEVVAGHYLCHHMHRKM